MIQELNTDSESEEDLVGTEVFSKALGAVCETIVLQDASADGYYRFCVGLGQNASIKYVSNNNER